MISNQATDAVWNLDLGPIKAKLMHVEAGEGWSRQRADAVEVEYRRFLHLMKIYPNEQLAPSEDIDTFWHYHILDTMKYAVDCETVFGYFLHHFPYLGLRGEDDEEVLMQCGDRMRELYESTFEVSYLRPVAMEAAADGTGEAAISAAYCSAPAKPTSAAYCSAPAKPTSAAYCSAPAKPVSAAYCSAPAKPVSAAYCSAPAKPVSVAYCSAPARPISSAYCSAPTKPINAAYCSAPSRPISLAYCSAPSKPISLAYCSAPAKPARPAYCSAPAGVAIVRSPVGAAASNELALLAA